MYRQNPKGLAPPTLESIAVVVDRSDIRVLFQFRKLNFLKYRIRVCTCRVLMLELAERAILYEASGTKHVYDSPRCASQPPRKLPPYLFSDLLPSSRTGLNSEKSVTQENDGHEN